MAVKISKKYAPKNVLNYTEERNAQAVSDWKSNKKGATFVTPCVIPLGLEPKTHALEGRCSNPTELRNLTFCGAILH